MGRLRQGPDWSGAHSVAQAGLELEILLHQPPEYWDQGVP
jgi:hypothetical protein